MRYIQGVLEVSLGQNPVAGEHALADSLRSDLSKSKRWWNLFSICQESITKP